MKAWIVAAALLGLIGPVGAQAVDITIPPLSECMVEDADQTQFRGAYDSSDPVECTLFDRAAEEGCEKGLKAANSALKECQRKGNGLCKLIKCWENPQ